METINGQNMPCRELGKSGLKVSAIGLGCMGMSHAYGAPADKKEMTELLARAVDMGYTFFDTAEAYGTHGCPHDNEELLGKALAPYRDKIVIATKFGIRFSGTAGTGPSPLITDSRPGTIRQSVEGSLKRLGVERIGLYYQHRMDDSVPPEEVAGVMQELIREGKIAHWGISEATEEAIRRAHGTCPIILLAWRQCDFIAAQKLASRGRSAEEIGKAMAEASPALAERKPGHEADYIERTVSKVMGLPSVQLARAELARAPAPRQRGMDRGGPDFSM